MGIAADLVLTMEGFKREELDAYGLETQQKAARAWDEGFFNRSLTSITRLDGRVVDRDELLRPATTLESLASLEPAFLAQGADGQDAIALAAHPEVSRIRHEHTVGTSRPSPTRPHWSSSAPRPRRSVWVSATRANRGLGDGEL